MTATQTCFGIPKCMLRK